jgi:hypothetical protein
MSFKSAADAGSAGVGHSGTSLEGEIVGIIMSREARRFRR